MDHNDVMIKLEQLELAFKCHKMEVTNVEPLKTDQFYINRRSHLFKPDYVRKKGSKPFGSNKKCNRITSTSFFNDWSI
jgi:hypothetical protein